MPGARGMTRPLIVGRRFVIHGLSRLTIRVARMLAQEMADVVILAPERDRGMAAHLDEGAPVIWVAGPLEAALEEAGLSGAQGLLVLGEEDRENLHAAVVAHAIAPAIPIVLRTFNPGLEDQLEGLNVRRAFSVSKLAAPAFVAAALGEEVVQTMHLGADEITLCSVVVNEGSPLVGATTDDLEARFHVSLLARAGETWEPATGEERVSAGDRILVGGPISDVLALAVRDHPIFSGRATRPTRPGSRQVSEEGRRSEVRSTLLPVAAGLLAVLLVAAWATFALALDLGPFEAAYFTITTAFGEATLARSHTGLQVLGAVTAVSAAALMAVVFGYLASVATARRLEARAGRRARKLQGHVVVAGLGTVGYRVAARLAETGITVAAVERSPDPRFREALPPRVPILIGDAQTPEALARARVGEAESFIACTNDDVANVLGCLHAKRDNPAIRTVARIFDETLAERAGTAFGIDIVLSTTRLAADAFANAATDERAPRRFALGPAPYLMVRDDMEEPVSPEQVRAWERDGLHLLAYRRGAGEAEPPSALDRPLERGDSAVFAGPEPVVRRILMP
jgi:Trk K+ transport system NAD-binding subunit